MKIESVVLKEMEIAQDSNGEFVQVFKNERKVPCFLTNFSLKRGNDLGLIKGSLIADLFKLNGLKDKKEVDQETLESLNESDMQKVIYLGCIGARKDTQMSFDKFLEEYHYSFEDTVMLYANLVTNLVANHSNGFAQSLKKSTKRKSNNGKKK